jgi:hypothetical protein
MTTGYVTGESIMSSHSNRKKAVFGEIVNDYPTGVYKNDNPIHREMRKPPCELKKRSLKNALGEVLDNYHSQIYFKPRDYDLFA